MNNHDYWKARELGKLKIYQREENQVLKEINAIYDETLANIQREIDSFYMKYALDEGITLSEARKRVSTLDIAEYEKKARRYVKTHDLSPQANQDMKIYNLTMKINRLEMLKAKIGLETTKAMDEVTAKVRRSLLKRCLDEFRTQAGILGKAVPNPEKNARAIVQRTTATATFDDRIWHHMSQLRSALDKVITSGIMQGKNPKKLAPDIRKAFGVTKYQAERLVRTEMARVQIQAAQDTFDENGFEEFEFIANYKDGKTCPICKDMDGLIRPVKLLKIGENAPPLHPNCRCAIAPYMSRKRFDAWLDAEIARRKGKQ